MTRRSVRLQRRSRRGRPRDATAARTASGRKSRARRPKEDPRTVALAARSRVLGLPAELAGHEKAATVLGRLWLGGEISGSLREAGERYIEIHAEAMRALTAPMGLTVSNKTGSAGDKVSEEYVAWATRAVARYRVVKAALEADGVHRIVHAVAVEDAPIPPVSRPEPIKGSGYWKQSLAWARRIKDPEAGPRCGRGAGWTGSLRAIALAAGSDRSAVILEAMHSEQPRLAARSLRGPRCLSHG